MINPSIAWHTFHQHHWIRISLLGLVLLFVFISSEGMERNQLIGLTPFLVWVLGSGIIGRDMASGVAHLLFTRPVSRIDYILTKWFSLAGAVVGFQCFIFLTWVLGNLVYHNHMNISAQLIQDFGISIWVAFVLSTVVIFFSTIMSGWGDLALLLYVHVIILILSISSLYKYFSHFDKFLGWLLRAVWPGAKIAFQYLQKDQTISFGDFAMDSIFATIYLIAAIILMSRKDIGNMST